MMRRWRRDAGCRCCCELRRHFGEAGKNTFDAVQAEGASVLRALRRKRLSERMVHISAIGADVDAKAIMRAPKAKARLACSSTCRTRSFCVRRLCSGLRINSFNRFAGMTRFSPLLPVVGADTKFQPVFVDSVAQAAERALTDSSVTGVYELGGPDVATFREMMQTMLGIVRRRRLIVNVPFFVGRIMGFGFGVAKTLSLGIVPAMITTDQVKNLAKDNVVSAGAKTLADLGVEPVALEAVLPEYLWRFRPSGQYDAIKESAKKLRTQL